MLLDFRFPDHPMRTRCIIRPVPQRNILALLKGGDRRSIGRSDQVAAIVSWNPGLFPVLIAGLWCDDPLVRMRAADATEKVTRKSPELLWPHKKELLGLMTEAKDPELRWHLCCLASIRVNLGRFRAAFRT
jgi:hypothetical protein